MEKELWGNELFTPFSLRCFPIGRNHLWGRFTILLIEKSQNKDRTSKSHYIAKCTLWECFSPWSYPGLVLISCRDIRLTPNDMVYVWVPWGWVLEGAISHFISWLPSCRRDPIWSRNERHFSISFPLFLPQKVKQLIVGQRDRMIGESLNGDSQGWEIIIDNSFPSYLEPHLNNAPNRWAGEWILSSDAVFPLFFQILCVLHMPRWRKAHPHFQLSVPSLNSSSNYGLYHKI